MNLRDIANCSTKLINPNSDVTIKKYNGYTIGTGQKRTVSYTDISTTAQVQPVPSYKLAHIDGYSSGAVYKTFYFNEDLTGVSAPTGNDMIVWGTETYKVVEQSEGWYATSGWTRVLGQRQ